MHTLIASVGYHNLRDLSVGPILLSRMKHLDWSPDIEFDDLSFGPIAVVQRFQDRPGYFDRIVFIAGVPRGRAPGTVESHQWNGILPSADEIQARIGEAVTGVVGLDNLLIIAQHFRVLPNDVRVIEIEPVDITFGLELTPLIESKVDEIIQAVKDAALDMVIEA